MSISEVKRSNIEQSLTRYPADVAEHMHWMEGAMTNAKIRAFVLGTGKYLASEEGLAFAGKISAQLGEKGKTYFLAMNAFFMTKFHGAEKGAEMQGNKDIVTNVVKSVIRELSKTKHEKLESILEKVPLFIKNAGGEGVEVAKPEQVGPVGTPTASDGEEGEYSGFVDLGADTFADDFVDLSGSVVTVSEVEPRSSLWKSLFG